MPVELTAATLQPTLERHGIVFLDWWAPWCGPCRAFAPIYDRVARAHPGVTFGKIDTEAQPALAAAWGIQSIPTLMVFRDGILLFNRPGMLPQAALEDLLRQVQALDMAQVRQEVEAARVRPAR